MKGSRTVSTVLVLVAALLGASLVATLFTDSPLRDVIDQGADDLSKRTDYTIQIGSDKNDLDAKEQFSDLAMLVYQRAEANGCADGGLVEQQKSGEIDRKGGEDAWNPRGINDQNGYPGLSHTYLGQNPPCYGAEGSPLRAGDGGGASVGNDMEGIYSREYFEIQKDFTLYGGGKPRDIDRPRAMDTWIERNLLGPGQGSRDQFLSECKNAEQYGTGRQYVIFYPDGVSNSRAGPWIRDTGGGTGTPVMGGIYCKESDSNGYDTNQIHPIYGERQGSALGEGGDEKVYMTFCEGDKGYMFVNKGKPQNDGEANARSLDTVIAGETGTFQNNAKFPTIVITETSKSDCMQGSTELSNVKYDVLQDSPTLADITVTVNNNGRKYYEDATLQVLDANGNTVKDKQIDISAGEGLSYDIGISSDYQDGFDPALCQVDIRITHSQLSNPMEVVNQIPTHRKGEEFNPYTTSDEDYSTCISNTEPYSFGIGTPEAEKQTDFWGLGGHSLEITIPVQNLGNQENNVFLRADFTTGDGKTDGRRYLLGIGEKRGMTVTKENFDDVDRCTVPVNLMYYHKDDEEWKKYSWGGSLYDPTSSSDTIEVDVSDIEGIECS